MVPGVFWGVIDGSRKIGQCHLEISVKLQVKSSVEVFFCLFFLSSRIGSVTSTLLLVSLCLSDTNIITLSAVGVSQGFVGLGQLGKRVFDTPKRFGRLAVIAVRVKQLCKLEIGLSDRMELC